MPRKMRGSRRRAVCVTVCNHWSYIGIGWQLGIESCVLSALDAMEMADRPPHVRTCVNQDARAYEYMAEVFPEITDRLKRYLAAGKVELVGGSYGQPLGTMYSGESNIRQLVVGRQVIRAALGFEPSTFLEQEEFSHPQMPQIIAGCGFKYASLAQADTWGRAGVPRTQVNALNWEGLDGTTIRSTPKNAGFYFSMAGGGPTPLDRPEFIELRRQGMPLIFSWEEFGWESAEAPDYLSKPAKYQAFASKVPTEFVTLQQYMDRYGRRPGRTIRYRMDDWDKLLSWGLGGDQLRTFDRQVETLLLSAERFDVVAGGFGCPTRAEILDRAWRDLLTSQSHDVSLCEYSRWQGDRMLVADHIEDHHSQTWGSIGWGCLDTAKRAGETVLRQSTEHLAKRIGVKARLGERLVTVFNPSQRTRAGMVTTGRLYPLPASVRDIAVTDAKGQAVPCQVVKSQAGPNGSLEMAEVAFTATSVPGVGYDTYRLRFRKNPGTTSRTPLRVDVGTLTMRNEHLTVRLDPTTGGVCSLVDRATGRQWIDASAGAWPTFRGVGDPKALPEHSWHKWFPGVDRSQPVRFDSSRGKSTLTWLANGPAYATLRAFQDGPLLKFETRITLAAGAPYVEVMTRILCHVPPLLDERAEGWPKFQGPIRNGYWLNLLPAFKPRRILRDYPLGVEETRRTEFHALTFVDLVDRDGGLLVLHPGTQYFARGGNGVLSNLLVREWESFFSREYGWPRYCEYRHALMPHGPRMGHAGRLHAVEQFTAAMPTVVHDGGGGDLPARHSGLTIRPDNLQLLALRNKPEGGGELRVVECEGRSAKGTVVLGPPFTHAWETDFMGNKVASAAQRGHAIRFRARPWGVHTFHLATMLEDA